MKRILSPIIARASRLVAAALTAFLIGASIANLHAATFSDDNWVSMGGIPGAGSSVVAAVVDGSGNLYIGGAFTEAGGVIANRIAKWDGSSWSALGSGMGGLDIWVSSLAVSGNALYSAGGFKTAGANVSAYVARAYLDLPTLSIFRSGGDMTLSWPVSFGRFALQQNPDAANPAGWSSANYPLVTNGATRSATVPITPTNQLFRLIGH